MLKLPATLILVLGSLAAQAKYQVCSITINSSDEIEMFKKSLPASEFDFHELSPKDENVENSSRDSRRVKAHFLKPYCVQHTRCDILVISGHFGGNFSGTANFSLALDDMNTLSCSNGCDGIFEAPKEVFLFGCNTLAGKTRDSRSPQEYVRVLIEHGYSESEARQISNLRYGPTGASFVDSMQRVFNRTPKIYGFNSISPRGSTAAEFLRNYFKKVGNYSEHLKGLRPESTNSELLHAFRDTSLVETAGRSSQERGLMCEILDPTTHAEEKVSLFEKAMSGNAPLTYIPSIQKSIREDREFTRYFQNKSTSAKLAEAFANMRKNFRVKELIDHALESMQMMLPANALDLMEFSGQMGWLDARETGQRKLEFYRQLIASTQPGAATSLCELRAYSVSLTTAEAKLLRGQTQEVEKVACLPDVSSESFFTYMTERMFELLSGSDRRLAAAYETWVFDTLMTHPKLGQVFVGIYLKQSDSIFFRTDLIQQGIDTNALLFAPAEVLKSMDERIRRQPKYKSSRMLFSSLTE